MWVESNINTHVLYVNTRTCEWQQILWRSSGVTYLSLWEACILDLWEICFGFIALSFVLLWAAWWLAGWPYPSGVCGFCRCGHSPVFRCREMSGRALVPFLVATEVPHTALTLLRGLPDSAAPGMRQNAVHGTLLQVSLFCIHLFLFCEGFKFFFYCWGFLKKFLVILDSQITYHELCSTFTPCQNIDEGCFWVYSVRW